MMDENVASLCVERDSMRGEIREKTNQLHKAQEEWSRFEEKYRSAEEKCLRMEATMPDEVALIVEARVGKEIVLIEGEHAEEKQTLQARADKVCLK